MQTVDLATHQRDAVDSLGNGKILWGGVGTGKSRVAIQYYVENEAPRDIVVLTTAKKRDDLDWESEAILHGIGAKLLAPLKGGNSEQYAGTDPLLLRGGASLRGLGTITVDSWNNIGKYAQSTDKFFIFDEQRVVGSGAWVKAFYTICKSNRWILLSGTPGDTWMDYIPVFVANGYYKNKTEFIREHVVFSPFTKFPKVDRYIAVGRLVRLRNEILVEMPYARHTNRVTTVIPVDYESDTYAQVEKKLWDIYNDEPIKDRAGFFRVVRRLVNSDPSRLKAVEKVMIEHPKLIIFYNFNYELDILRTLDDGSFAVAEYNGSKHEPVPTGDKWAYLVQYVAGAEGWNCIETDATLFYSLPYSYKNFEQAHGRIDRLNTPFTDLYYFILMSRSKVDRGVMTCLRVKKSFNEVRSKLSPKFT